jgi:hypothetical protein
MQQKGFAPILIVLIFSVIFVVAGAGYWYSASNKKVAEEQPKQDIGIQNSGSSNNETSSSSPLYPDLSQPEKLVGKSHNIFVGKVIKVAGTIGNRNSIDPNGRLLYKQFEVKVLSNIKGDLSGSVLVNVEDGGRTKLSTGATYLLATRYRKQDSSYTLLEVSHGWKLLSENDTLSDAELINLAEKDARVNELRMAYPNEIVGEGAVRAGTDLNSFRSLPAAEQDRLKAEAEQLKTQIQQ